MDDIVRGRYAKYILEECKKKPSDLSIINGKKLLDQWINFRKDEVNVDFKEYLENLFNKEISQ